MIVRPAKMRELLALARFEPGVPLHELERLLASGRVLIAQRGDDWLGLLRWGLLWDELPMLHRLSIAPDRRGKGYGMQLLLQWERTMQRLRHTHVLAIASSGDDAGFLRHMGYVDCGWLHLPGHEAALLYQKVLSAR